jgi:hypothetical protein
MFSMPRGVHGPNPGGPITRWHTHTVCVRNGERGKSPRRDGSCPPGSRKQQGTEMMHIWLTNDIRGAFAIHAPTPELCAAALLPDAHCDHQDEGAARTAGVSRADGVEPAPALDAATIRLLCVVTAGGTPSSSPGRRELLARSRTIGETPNQPSVATSRRPAEPAETDLRAVRAVRHYIDRLF